MTEQIMTLEQLRQRLKRLQHAMQTGIATIMNYKPSVVAPKHLRVGINSALVDTATIAQLLIKKGVFSEEEYMTGLCEELEKEVQRYQNEIQETLGTDTKITLH